MAKSSCVICGKEAVARGWCKSHYRRWSMYGNPTHVPSRPGREDLFWAKVDKSGDCWLWTASINASGYGSFGAGGKSRLAHRVAYEFVRGEIPAGLTLDHLCRVRSCVNPDHLEPVTARENTRRGFPGAYLKAKKCCPRGHVYDEENTKISSRGTRSCKACQSEYRKTYFERHPERERERWRRQHAKRSAERAANPPAPKTHCPKGHPYSDENLYNRPDGRRGCKACRKAASDRYVAKKRAAQA